MSKRISGMSFDTYLDGDLIHIEKITLDITERRRPDPWCAGWPC